MALKEKQREKRAAKQNGQTFSTAINLTEPREQQHSHRLKDASGAEQDAFAQMQPPMPATIQQYMLRQGFSGATPIQERCVCIATLSLL